MSERGKEMKEAAGGGGGSFVVVRCSCISRELGEYSDGGVESYDKDLGDRKL